MRLLYIRMTQIKKIMWSILELDVFHSNSAPKNLIKIKSISGVNFSNVERILIVENLAQNLF